GISNNNNVSESSESVENDEHVACLQTFCNPENIEKFDEILTKNCGKTESVEIFEATSERIPLKDLNMLRCVNTSLPQLLTEHQEGN
ncbi:hypothetical protein TNCV_3153061, partial [Trichonephila clavipes]